MVVALLFLPSVAAAHPGRLDRDGCHTVHNEYVYKDGRVLPKGDHHCHRTLGQGLTLDGKERLAHEPDAPSPSDDARVSQ